MKEKKKQDVKEQKTVVYIGPTIQGVVRKNTIYTNGLPKALVEIQKTMPIVNNLVIDINELNEARKKLNNPSSALSAIYNKVLESTGGKE